MEQFYQEPARRIPVKATPEVLVVGSGPAGVAAAVAAARNGANTMLIEQCATLGGVSTTGLMSHWTGSVDSRLYREILQRSAQLNEGEYHNRVDKYIDPEKLKYLYLTMLQEAGVKVQLYTFASDVIMEGECLKGVITESKSGREAIFAKVVVDATGDGDVAARTGASFHLGREEDGRMQPVTLMFKVAGVDYSRAVFPGSFETLVNTQKGELQALAREHISQPAGHVLLYRSTLPGIVTCNMTNATGIDGTRAEDLTRAEFLCRGQMWEILDYLRNYVPGYENCYIISSGSFMGVRETRHFQGMYTLTQEDILAARSFPDWVVRNAHFNFDVHNISGSGLDPTGSQAKFTQEKGYDIPYGCLVPERVDGLLLTGRNISGTHMAHSNYRVMPICAALGEAAGAAAALAAGKCTQPRMLPVEEIQRLLV